MGSILGLGTPVGRVVTLLALAMVAGPGLTGCELLNPPADTFGGTVASYQTGHATMTIGDQTIKLDQISPGPHLMRDLGAEVYWFNDAGWGLRLSGGGGASAFAMPASVAIDRVRTTYLSAMDDNGECKVKLDEIDEQGLRGTATCTGLRWADMLRGGIGGYGDTGGDRYDTGEPPFDATITFEALPKPPSS
jgi:hypothetical protein